MGEYEPIGPALDGDVPDAPPEEMPPPPEIPGGLPLRDDDLDFSEHTAKSDEKDMENKDPGKTASKEGGGKKKDKKGKKGKKDGKDSSATTTKKDDTSVETGREGKKKKKKREQKFFERRSTWLGITIIGSVLSTLCSITIVGLLIVEFA